LILLVAAGLFLRTLQKLEAVPLGFDSDRVLVVSVNASHSSVAPANRTALYGRLAEASARVPGVAYAAASLNTPVNRGVTLVSDFTSQGGLAVEANERRAIVNFVTPGWFETYGIAINAGRPPDARDSAAAPPVAVVNESFARRYFGASRAVGRYISATIGPPEARPPTLVIGVSADAIDQSIRFGAFPTVYQPLSQLSAPLGMLGASEFSVSVRAASGPPAALIRPVAAALTGVDRSLTFSFYLLEDQVRGARNQERLVAWLAGFFGGLALLLAAIGLYGVTSFLAARRRAEIAIRIALGARRRDVVGLSIQQTAATAAIGLVAGLAVAAAVTRSLQSLLFAVTPLDPATFIGAPILLAAIALLACYLPARRAARIDPMIALRAE
jgi:predicted permease